MDLIELGLICLGVFGSAIIGLFIGTTIAKAETPKDENENGDENGNGGEYEGYPDFTGIKQLSELEYETSTWKNFTLHSYFLGDNEYLLTKVNLVIDKLPNQRWSGINQCLFYMSDEAIPNKPELYEIRTNCNSNKTPWKLEAELIKKKTGRYFIIGFTNNHDFTADGEIELK